MAEKKDIYVPDSEEGAKWICSAKSGEERTFRLKVWETLTEGETGWDKLVMDFAGCGVEPNILMKHAISGATWEDIKSLTDLAWKSKK
jgi:hypothetical protein